MADLKKKSIKESVLNLLYYGKKILINAMLLSKGIIHYSGLEYLFRKFIPKDKKTLPTGFIWLVGIYVALFGIASQYYENRVDIIETRTDSILNQLNTASYKKALSRIPDVQNMLCPIKPELLKPNTVIRSIFGNGVRYNECIKRLKGTIEDWKDSLDNVNLRGVILREAELGGANFQGALLNGADFRGANLYRANFQNASILNANFTGADLREANLEGIIDYDKNWSREIGHYVPPPDKLPGSYSKLLCTALSLKGAKVSSDIKEELFQYCPEVFGDPIPGSTNIQIE